MKLKNDLTYKELFWIVVFTCLLGCIVVGLTFVIATTIESLLGGA